MRGLSAHFAKIDITIVITIVIICTIEIKEPISQSNVCPCLCLRVENRPSVLGIFIYVPWGGVGWGNNVHVLAHSHDVTPRHVHLHVRTIAQIRHATLKMCHVTQGWGGVGWGGVGWAITFTYLRTPIMLRHGTFTCTCAHTSCYVEDVSRHAGVGWGGVG